MGCNSCTLYARAYSRCFNSTKDQISQSVQRQSKMKLDLYMLLLRRTRDSPWRAYKKLNIRVFNYQRLQSVRNHKASSVQREWSRYSHGKTPQKNLWLLQFTNNQVKLAEAADLSIFTPVCMPRQTDYTDLRTTVIGWGETLSQRMPGDPPVTKAVSWLRNERNGNITILTWRCLLSWWS